MNKILSYSIIACLLLVPFHRADAETVTASKAEQAARSFFSSTALTKAAASDIRLVHCGTGTKAVQAPYYIFNAGSEGFVVIASDDGMMPVLGYSLTGVFDADDLPDGLAALLDTYRRNVNDLRSGKAAPAEGALQSWSGLLSPTKAAGNVSTVVNLHTALWDQGDPYYDKCPEYGGERCLTGCANTALAILMKFYNYPDAGYGTVPSYTTAEYKITVPGKTLGEPYDWANMLEDYSGVTPTEQQKEAVSTLMADLGLIIQSDYGPKGTSTSFANVLPGMLKYMKYSASATVRDRENYSTQEWCTFLKNDLDAGHPVYYAGQENYDRTSGHAYIIDGYDSDGRMHFNWGWSGHDNGFFYVPDTEYSSLESAIFGLVPDDSWTGPASGYSLTYYKFESGNDCIFPIWTSVPYVEENEQFQIGVTIANTGDADYSGSLKFCVRHADRSVTDIGVSDNVEIKVKKIKLIPIDATLTTISEGDEIVLYYKSGDDWVLLDDGVKALPLRYRIPDVVSMEYSTDATNKYLTIYAPLGMTLDVDGTGFTFGYSQKLQFTNPAGSSDFTFSNGHESYTVRLTF